MTPAEFAAWLAHMGWSKRRAARELDCSFNSVVKWLEKGDAPRSIDYACFCLANGLPKWSDLPRAPRRDVQQTTVC